MPSRAPERDAGPARPDDTSRSLERAFWRYSLQRWARPEFAQACLSLQEAQGADANLLLFCCWMGRRRQHLDRRSLVRARSVVAGWQDCVVQPLRGVRGSLKRKTALVEAEQADLRRRVAALELRSEYIEQLLLARYARSLPQIEGGAPVLQIATSNLTRYLQLLQAPADIAAEAAAALAAQA